MKNKIIAITLLLASLPSYAADDNLFVTTLGKQTSHVFIGGKQYQQIEKNYSVAKDLKSEIGGFQRTIELLTSSGKPAGTVTGVAVGEDGMMTELDIDEEFFAGNSFGDCGITEHLFDQIQEYFLNYKGSKIKAMRWQGYGPEKAKISNISQLKPVRNLLKGMGYIPPFARDRNMYFYDICKIREAREAQIEEARIAREAQIEEDRIALRIKEARIENEHGVLEKSLKVIIDKLGARHEAHVEKEKARVKRNISRLAPAALKLGGTVAVLTVAVLRNKDAIIKACGSVAKLVASPT